MNLILRVIINIIKNHNIIVIIANSDTTLNPIKKLVPMAPYEQALPLVAQGNPSTGL